MSEVISIKVSAAQKARLQRAADQQKLSLSGLIRKGLEAAISSEGSCYDHVSHLFEQPGWIGRSQHGDLSTNKKRLQEFGRKP